MVQNFGSCQSETKNGETAEMVFLQESKSKHHILMEKVKTQKEFTCRKKEFKAHSLCRVDT